VGTGVGAGVGFVVGAGVGFTGGVTTGAEGNVLGAGTGMGVGVGVVRLSEDGLVVCSVDNDKGLLDLLVTNIPIPTAPIKRIAAIIPIRIFEKPLRLYIRFIIAQNYFNNSSMETSRAFAIFSTMSTDGVLITPLSILVSVVYFTPDFWAKSSCESPNFVRHFLMFSPILFSVAILAVS